MPPPSSPKKKKEKRLLILHLISLLRERKIQMKKIYEQGEKRKLLDYPHNYMTRSRKLKIKLF